MNTQFARFVLSQPDRLRMPIGVYGGLRITGASVQDAVTNAAAQAEAVLALHERFATQVLLTAMDLSAEAETFGCRIRMSEDEIPTVIGRRVSSLAEVGALPAPQPGDLRTGVHLNAARLLVQSEPRVPLLAGMIGPFSLASRIFGVSELLEATLSEPETVERLLERTNRFLIAYARAFRETGAGGLLIAEPAAGLLSPRGLSRFSAPYVQEIVSGAQTEQFAVVLHNCGARLAHLPAILQSGAEIYHFGAPMDLPAALQQTSGRVILAGNLDPAGVFLNGTPETVRQATESLLGAAAEFPNFILSSGCDLPPGTPLENLDAFYTATPVVSKTHPE